MKLQIFRLLADPVKTSFSSLEHKDHVIFVYELRAHGNVTIRSEAFGASGSAAEYFE